MTGHLDHRTAPALRERLLNLMPDGQRHVVLDLNRAELLDSTGLGVLVRAADRRPWLHGRALAAYAVGIC